MVKKCEYCGREFYAEIKRRIYCSENCRKKGKKKKAKERFAEQYAAYVKEKEIRPVIKNDLVDIAVKARQAGMSYGYYVGLTEYKPIIVRKWW